MAWQNCHETRQEFKISKLRSVVVIAHRLVNNFSSAHTNYSCPEPVLFAE